MPVTAMPSPEVPIQHLLTLPPCMAQEFEALEGRRRPEWFAASDPPGQPLGSGGGTANLLAEAWRATAPGQSFADWLRQSHKLILHAGGQSRRLPAYAPVGKLLMPIPVFRWSRGQRLDQSLLDLQLPDYQRVLAHASENTAALVTSGNVLLRFARELPPFPRGGRSWPRHEARSREGQRLRRLLLPAGPPYGAGVLPAEAPCDQDP